MRDEEGKEAVLFSKRTASVSSYVVSEPKKSLQRSHIYCE
jgi:hypothetical protein